jgi:hypothetical protein
VTLSPELVLTGEIFGMGVRRLSSESW